MSWIIDKLQVQLGDEVLLNKPYESVYRNAVMLVSGINVVNFPGKPRLAHKKIQVTGQLVPEGRQVWCLQDELTRITPPLTSLAVMPEIYGYTIGGVYQLSPDYLEFGGQYIKVISFISETAQPTRLRVIVNGGPKIIINFEDLLNFKGREDHFPLLEPGFTYLNYKKQDDQFPAVKLKKEEL